jgi:hypothetical protein
MKREIVVFERVIEDREPELDFRLIRQALPDGSSPLAIADKDGFSVHCGQEFLFADVKKFAEEQSGFSAAD